MNKVWSIVRKEWAEVFRHRLVLFSTLFLPLMVALIPMVILGSGGQMDGTLPDELGELAAGMQALCAGLSPAGCNQLLILQQFLAMFLLVPAIIPVTIAAYSIVGEKTARTLEPLLATPISTGQLLGGKALAAVIPGLLATFLSFGLFAAGTAFLAADPGVAGRLLSPVWVLSIFIVGPLLAVAGVCVAVMISSRVNDPRAAEQIATLVMLPVLALFFGQIAGFVAINIRLMLLVAAGMLALDAALLFFATQLFARETILTRWK